MAKVPSSTTCQGTHLHIKIEESDQTHSLRFIHHFQPETLCVNTGETRDEAGAMEMDEHPFFSTADEFPFFPDSGLQQVDVSSFSSLRSVIETSPDSDAFDIKLEPMTTIEHTAMITLLQAPSIGIDSPTGDTASQHATSALTPQSATIFSSATQPPASDTIDATTFARLLISQQPSLASCCTPILNLPFLDQSSLFSVSKHTTSSDATTSPASYPSSHSRPVRASTSNSPSPSRSSLVEKTPRRSPRILSSSSVTQHFSDLSNSKNSTSTSLSPTTIARAFPTSSSSSLSSVSSSSYVYFPPTASALHQKRRKDKRQALRAPRPRNCFMLYRSKVLPQIMVELGTINNKIISKIAAERWRAEKEDVKAWYRMMAKRGKEEHARNNPGYKYAPYKKQMMAEMRNIAHSGQETSTACGHQVDYGQELRISLFNEEGRPSLDPASFDSQAQTSSSKKANAATRLLNVLKGKSSLSSSRSPAKRSRLNEPTSSGLSSKLSGLLQPFSNTLLGPWTASGVLNGAPLVSFAAGTGLIEQQLYHNSHQKNHMSQQFQSQYPIVNSLYNMADTNSSSATLVDPQNQWLQQRYHYPCTLNDYLGLTTQQQLAQSFSQMKETSSCAVSHPYLTFHTSASPLPLPYKGEYDLDKDLPPLPVGTLNHISSQVLAHPVEQDCQSIMAQLFENYNGDFDSSLTPSNSQSVFYLDHNNGMWPEHQQVQPLQQSQPPQQQQQHSYLIKPSSPQFLSFADLIQAGEQPQGGQLPRQPQNDQDPSSMLLMDLFSWPPPM
ncbi:hypothetical protein BGZ82_009100 [Podila clonocystis]|nr:hypothetical protein BGZ82_009100 [Podila clonocystis]